MTFGKGEIVLARSLSEESGEEALMLSYTENWTEAKVIQRLAPGLNLTDFREKARRQYGRSFIARLSKEEVRDVVFYEPRTTNP